MANGSLTSVAGLAIGLVSAWLPTPAAAQCQLCTPTATAAAAGKPTQPITIQIETRIDFSKIGLVTMNQGGTATLDPVTGLRVLSGSLLDLGGVPIIGTVVVTGEPRGNISVTFPTSVQLFNSTGNSVPLSNFTTSLKNNPKLADDGTLRFTFGGLLRIDGASTGTFRGSIPITVDYK